MNKILMAFVCLCLLSGCLSVPKHSESSIQFIAPAPRITYYIRTRIVLEYVVSGTEDNPTIDFAKLPDEIDQDLAFTNNLLSEADIQLVADTRELVYLDGAHDTSFFLREDARCYDDRITIYYLFPRPECFTFFGRNGYMMGFAPLPWMTEYGHGIAIYGKLSNPATLAHEVGHAFGLQHSFQAGNPVPDVEGGQNPDYHNVMNYTNSQNVNFTAGQLDLMFCIMVTHYHKMIILMKSAA